MPVKYALWIIKAAELQPVIARVVNVAQGEEKGTYNITAVPHNPNKYQSIENDLMLDVPPTSILNSRNQEPPASVEIKSEIITTQNVAKTRLVISWKEAKNAARYEVEWKRNDGNWVKLPQTTSLSIEVEDVYAGAYTARVVAYNLFGARSYPKYSTSTDVKGKVGKPTNVLSLTTTPLLFGMKLDWVYPAGNSDLSHVVIEVSDRADGSNPRLLGNVSYPTNTLTIQGLQGGLDQWYRTKTVDKSGNESDWSTFVKGTTGNDPDLVLDLISGQIKESDLAQELQGKIENSANVAEAAQTAATDAQTAAVNAQTSANEAASVASKTASDLQSVTDQLNKEISDEANARIAAIAQLNDGLTTETTQRKSEDAALLSNIETYKSSTNGTLSSLQEQITTNATNTSANASKISSLDSRLTTNEGKTADAINSAATAQQTASTAVEKANAAANSVTSLKSELSTGKGVNNIIAPFSDPQELSPYLTGANRTVALVKSPMRINGKAYDVTFNAVAGNIYFGSSSNATVNTTAAGTITGGKRYMFSAYLKNLDATKQAEVNFMIYWFRRTSGGISITQALLVNQTTNITRITPSNDGGTISFKSVTAPSDAFAFIFLCYGNGVYNVAGSRILIDMLMLEEVVGVDVPASTWTAGPADLSAIKSALDANASAISNLKTRVTNAEGVITSQGDSITQLNNSVTSINGELTKKAESSALQALDSKVSNIGGQVTTNTNSITSLNSRVTNAEGDISIANGAINSLSTRISDAEGKLTSQSEAVTQLSDQIGNTKSYSILTFRNGSAIGMPKDGGIHSFKGKINGFGRGLNLIVFNNGDVVSCNNYDTYGYMESACQDLNNAIQGLNSGTYFAIVGTDNIGSVAVHGAAENLRATLLACGASRSYLNTWVGNSLPIFIGRKDLDAGNGILGMFDSTVSNQWIEYPLTFVSGVPMGMGDARAITTLLDANASAISSLSNTVTQQGNSITSNSNSITSLSNTITNNDLTNWVRNANFADPRNDWSSGTIVDAVNAAPNPPSPKALALNYRDNYYGPMFRCNAGDMYYVSAWFASPVAGDAYSSLGFHYFDTAGNQGWVGVVFTTQEKRRSWTMLEGYFTVPEGMAQLHPWLQVSAWDTVPNEKWHVTNIQVRNITGNKKLVSDLQANSTALNNLSSRVSTTEGNIASQSSSITSLTNQIGNTKSYSIVTFRNGSAASSMPKPSGIHSFQGRVGTFGRGLNLIVFNNNGDVVSCTAYDTYGDIVGNCNALYYAVNALASGTYFAIVGNDNIRDVGVLNPDTPLRELMLSCGASDKYFKSWNWNSLPIFIGRKDVGAGNGILGMFDSELPNQWIEYPLVFVGGAPVGMGDSRAVTTQLDANAAAISSLFNTVTQQGNDIISHSNALTSLSASVSGIYKDIQLTDTRNDNQPPAWYWQNHGLKIVREFKTTAVLGLSGLMPDLYVTLETQVPWTDPSGGPIIQIARGSSSAFTAERRSADYNSWFAWSQDIKALSDGLSNKAEASALSSLDAKVSTIDGKVSTQATSITNLQTTVGGHTASIQSQQQSIDGLKSRATLKLQSGNLIGGVGIENDSKTVDFIIQANKFAIAPPSNAAAGSVAPKYAFVYQPTATTLPNGTVVPAGLYLDNASIGYINAEKINASSLSAISANLGTLITLKDPTKPNGARMVITGSLTTVYDDNNVARIRLGIW
ncbi:interleukin-like EMT inducer domain-containing protein [Acinetobacter baumannii]